MIKSLQLSYLRKFLVNRQQHWWAHWLPPVKRPNLQTSSVTLSKEKLFGNAPNDSKVKMLSLNWNKINKLVAKALFWLMSHSRSRVWEHRVANKTCIKLVESLTHLPNVPTPTSVNAKSLKDSNSKQLLH